MNREVSQRMEIADMLRANFAAATAGKVGLVMVPVEERPFPLWLRAGTEDTERAVASFNLRSNGLQMAHQPRRILEIGAGAGYRTAALAHAYPGAEIIATEADAACYRAAMLNTLPYGNVTCLAQAIAADAGRYGFHGREGKEGRLRLVRDETGSITATPLQHLLNYWRWRDVDTLVLTPDAASLEILRAPLPAGLRLVAVETCGMLLEANIAAQFPNNQFLMVMSGDYVLFYHRALQKAPPAPARPAPVFAPDGQLRGLRLENGAEDSFFPVGPNGFRLSPNAYGAPPARLTLAHESMDYSELQVSMRVVQPEAPPVRFTVKMLSAFGETLATASEVVKGGMARGTVIHLPEYEGLCDVVFMAEVAVPGDGDADIWAEFISATFV
jgi:hypothetical protein